MSTRKDLIENLLDLSDENPDIQRVTDDFCYEIEQNVCEAISKLESLSIDKLDNIGDALDILRTIEITLT